MAQRGTMELPARICGTETEYGTLCNYGPNSTRSSLSGSDLKRVLEAGEAVGEFLGNGARLYIDVGEHVEYATPETLDPLELTACEMAGDTVALAALSKWAQQYQVANHALYRRVSDGGGAYWGSHENYSLPRKVWKDYTQGIANVAFHIATRNILTGPGAIAVSGKYVLWGKAPVLSGVYLQGTTYSKRPLIANRNEPLAISDKYMRLNVVGGAPNQSPWATRMKIGTTLLLLDCIEQGHDLKKFMLPDGQAFYGAINTIATDLSMQRPIRLQNGTSIRPVDAQIELLQSAEMLREVFDLKPWQEWTLNEWRRGLEDLEVGGGEAIADRADWPTRLQIIEDISKKHDVACNLRQEKPAAPDPLHRSTDYEYDKIGEDTIAAILRRKKWSAWMPDASLIQDRTTTPPANTRAHLRGAFIRAVAMERERVLADKRDPVKAAVSWFSVSYGGTLYKLYEPAKPVYGRLEKRIEMLEAGKTE